MSQQSANSSRRNFLKTAAAGTVIGTIGSASGSVLASSEGATQESKSAADLVAGKSKEMIVLKPFPAVFETPTKKLAAHSITPVSHLFVRNNQQPKAAATTAPLPAKGWKIQIKGLVNKEIELEASELSELPQTQYHMVLQCSGNSRALFAQAVKTAGTQWGRGGVGNVKFSGVLLSKLLDAKGIDVKKAATWVRACGHDKPLPDKEDFEHSLPVEDVLQNSILATSLNGKPLPAIHGGPVRLITPGIYGTMQLKWLSELNFENEESTNYNHIPRYRVPKGQIKPGTDYKFTLENSTYNWKMKLKSILLSPWPAESLDAGKNRIEGIAFNDGECGIETVLVSLDKGTTWRKANLDKPSSKYAWTRFSLDAQFERGRTSIWTMAVDAFGRSQPMDGTLDWNPRGYEWNGVEKIDVKVN